MASIRYILPTTVPSRTLTLLSSLNPHAPLYTSSNGVVDLTSLLHLDAYSTSPFRAPSLPASDPDHDRDHPSQRHHGLSTLTIQLPTLPSIVGGRFDETLRTLLWEGTLGPPDADDEADEGEGVQTKQIQVLRCKGLLFSSPSPSPSSPPVPPEAWLVQGVREIYDITPLGPASPDDLAAGPRLVLIGRGFPGDLSSQFLASLRA